MARLPGAAAPRYVSTSAYCTCGTRPVRASRPCSALRTVRSVLPSSFLATLLRAARCAIVRPRLLYSYVRASPSLRVRMRTPACVRAYLAAQTVCCNLGAICAAQPLNARSRVRHTAYGIQQTAAWREALDSSNVRLAAHAAHYLAIASLRLTRSRVAVAVAGGGGGVAQGAWRS